MTITYLIIFLIIIYIYMINQFYNILFLNKEIAMSISEILNKKIGKDKLKIIVKKVNL